MVLRENQSTVGQGVMTPIVYSMHFIIRGRSAKPPPAHLFSTLTLSSCKQGSNKHNAGYS